MPATVLRARVCAFIGDARRAQQFGIEPRIDVRKRMDDFLRPIMINDPCRSGFSRSVFVEKLRLRGLQTRGLEGYGRGSEKRAAE
jgi:hypothetical protein